MSTAEARNLYARRKELSEPTFGILKEQLGARRFLLRGLTNVQAEFTLLSTAFNLRNVIPGLEQGKKNGPSGAAMAISKTDFKRI